MTSDDKIKYLKEMRDALSAANMYSRNWDDAVDEAIADIEFTVRARDLMEDYRSDQVLLEKELDEMIRSMDAHGAWKYKWISFEEEIPEQGVHIQVTTIADIVTMAFVSSKKTEKLQLMMIDPISYRLIQVDNLKEYNITHWAKMSEGYKGE